VDKVYEYRLRFSKEQNFRFFSHLELIKTIERALRRAEIPLAYSEGYHPHPKLSFGPALAVGVNSIDEYFDLGTKREWQPETIITTVNRVLPRGLRITAARQCLSPIKPLNAIINRAAYVIELETEPAMSGPIIDQLQKALALETLCVTRTNKNGSKTVNIRPWIHNFTAEIISDTRLQLRVNGEIGSGGNLRPEDFLGLVTHPIEVLNIVRVSLWHEQPDGTVKKPLDFCEKTGG
jgi:radical SAM-linked protein